MTVWKWFTVLKRLHRSEVFRDFDDHKEFQEKLAAMVKRGIVEPLSPRKHLSSLDEEVWFRDKLTGVVYRYVPPDWPSPGYWGPVEHPGEPSYFESLCADLYPTRAQYDALVRKLDEAWDKGEIECGQHPVRSELEDAFFHHPKSDETYHLILANPYQPGGSWMKVYHSRKKGTWPGEIILGPPPWRRSTTTQGESA